MPQSKGIVKLALALLVIRLQLNLKTKQKSIRHSFFSSLFCELANIQLIYDYQLQ